MSIRAWIAKYFLYYSPQAEQAYREAFEAGMRRAGEVCWAAGHYLACEDIRKELGGVVSTVVDTPVNAYLED